MVVGYTDFFSVPLVPLCTEIVTMPVSVLLYSGVEQLAA